MKIWILTHIILLASLFLWTIIPRKDDNTDKLLSRIIIFFGTLIALIFIESFIAVLIFM